jgi:hypothetical protein
MEGNLLKAKKNCWSKFGLLAKTLNKASLFTSKIKFVIDIQCRNPSLGLTTKVRACEGAG